MPRRADPTRLCCKNSGLVQESKGSVFLAIAERWLLDASRRVQVLKQKEPLQNQNHSAGIETLHTQTFFGGSK